MRDPIDPAYGSSLWRLWLQDLRDRRQGNRARANARWGLLNPPSGRGKLIWIKAGGGVESVLLGAETTRAIREKRLDVRLALTFEQDFPQVIAPRLKGLRKVGIAYGPSDTPGTVRRMLRAFSPLAVVFAGTTPSPHLHRALAESGAHTVVLNALPGANIEIEAAYPANADQAQAWREQGRARYLAPNAALLTLLVDAQVDPNFKRYVSGPQDLDLWWVQGATPDDAVSLARHWEQFNRETPGVLFIGEGESGMSWPGPSAAPIVPISEWRRAPLPAGTVVLVDDRRWLPALAASCTAAHLMRPSALAFWQALAGGCPVSFADAGFAQAQLNEEHKEGCVALNSDDALIDFWRASVADPIAARKRGDTLRRLFWNERRRAATVADELLQRIYDW